MEMNDKMNKWLCENFKNGEGDVTIGSILRVCLMVGVVLFVMLAVLIGALGLTGFVAQGIYMDIINNEDFDINRSMCLSDIMTGFVILCVFVFIVYILNLVLEYKVTSCKRED
jgi:hypothetical protein